MKKLFKPSKNSKHTGDVVEGASADNNFNHQLNLRDEPFDDNNRNSRNVGDANRHQNSTGDISTHSTLAMDGSHSSYQKKSLRSTGDGGICTIDDSWTDHTTETLPSIVSECKETDWIRPSLNVRGLEQQGGKRNIAPRLSKSMNQHHAIRDEKNASVSELSEYEIGTDMLEEESVEAPSSRVRDVGEMLKRERNKRQVFFSKEAPDRSDDLNSFLVPLPARANLESDGRDGARERTSVSSASSRKQQHKHKHKHRDKDRHKSKSLENHGDDDGSILYAEEEDPKQRRKRRDKNRNAMKASLRAEFEGLLTTEIHSKGMSSNSMELADSRAGDRDYEEGAVSSAVIEESNLRRSATSTNDDTPSLPFDDKSSRRRQKRAEQNEAKKNLQRSIKSTGSPAGSISSVDHAKEERRRLSRAQDEEDKKLKKINMEQREAAKALRSSATSSVDMAGKATSKGGIWKEEGVRLQDSLISDESARSREKRTERDVLDSVLKKSIKSCGSVAGSVSSMDIGKDERRRRRHAQDEEDRKLKQSLKEQREAAKALKSSATSSVGSTGKATSKGRTQEGEVKRFKDSLKHKQAENASVNNDSPSHSIPDESARRRQMRAEQDELERALKQSIKEQRNFAKSPGSTAANVSSVDGTMEEQRRRRRAQDEEDRKLKQSIKEQRDAAKASGKSVSTVSRPDKTNWKGRTSDEEDEKFKASNKQQRAAGTYTGAASTSSPSSTVMSGSGKSKGTKPDLDTTIIYDIEKVSITEDSVDENIRSVFEQSDELDMYHEQTEAHIRQDEQKQNLIDLHMAQFLVTNRGSKESFLGNSKDLADELYDDFDEDYDNFDVKQQLPSLSEFEEEQRALNRSRRKSRRTSETTMKINAWHQKYTLKKAIDLAESSPEMEWLSSFYRSDPRWQIMKFFDEVAREGGDAPMDEDVAASPLMNLFQKANVFTVWRPTSLEAIKNMMLGIATGKGLDIKGKSAKRGNISSYVPFIQIYEEQHKEHFRAYIKDGRTIRVFYQDEASRTEAYEMINDIKDFMLFAAKDAMQVLSDEYADPSEQELAMKHLMYDDSNLGVILVDTYANSNPPCFGLDITERLFWESYVMMNDCSRPHGTEWDIGRNSELTFMDMNFKAIRHEPGPGEPRAVVYQMSTCSPMEPRMLLMAYEENNKVKPVVSDFDCFLLGSRGVRYKHPIPDDQIELVKWSVENISEVLDEQAANPTDNVGWMETWFKVLKKAALKGYYPKTPKYGNGDRKSYEIIEVAVSRLQETGCVRHGAECFNWFFPQEIDDTLLVISDTLPGNVKWKYVDVEELQNLLCEKIDEGFTFPLNPKWVLCDHGWRRVYDKLLASRKPNVQDSLNCWLPPGTSLRQQIDEISKKHPRGFGNRTSWFENHRHLDKAEGTEAMDTLEDELSKYMVRQRAWRKLRLALFWIRYIREKRAAIGENRGWKYDE